MIYLDTNTLIRFFTNDIPEKAQKVEFLLEQKTITIPDVVFPELEYVLTHQYDTSRTDIMKLYKFLNSKENVRISSPVRQAFTIFKTTKLDMADCIVAAYSQKGSLATFDQGLLQLDTITPYWK